MRGWESGWAGERVGRAGGCVGAYIICYDMIMSWAWACRGVSCACMCRGMSWACRGVCHGHACVVACHGWGMDMA